MYRHVSLLLVWIVVLLPWGAARAQGAGAAGAGVRVDVGLAFASPRPPRVPVAQTPCIQGGVAHFTNTADGVWRPRGLDVGAMSLYRRLGAADVVALAVDGGARALPTDVRVMLVWRHNVP